MNSKGVMTAAGNYYFAKITEQPPDRQFDPTQNPTRAARGRSEQIKLRDGTHAIVRSWNHIKGEWRVTKLGKEF